MPNPKVTLVATGDRKFFPTVLDRWTMNENTNEIWQVQGTNLRRHIIGEYFGNSVENAVKNQKFGGLQTFDVQAIIDYKASKVFTKDFLGKKIYSTNLNGENQKLIFTTPNSSQIICMDVDNTKGIIYYADAGTNSIKSVKTDGTNPKEIIKNAGINNTQIGYVAQDIHVDGSKGKIYWIKDNKAAKRLAIMKANTDGTGVTTLWDATYSGLNGSGFNLHFVIDEQSQQIFFVRTLLETNKLDTDNFHKLYRDHLIKMDTSGKNLKALFSAEYKPVAWGQSELFQLTISKQEPLN
ncbi:MAG: hypothetical protein IPJ81_14885 [Chitinophagaceae bacterium]|nr:hypothetical protein [Chitinophagaceae bacterium]